MLALYVCRSWIHTVDLLGILHEEEGVIVDVAREVDVRSADDVSAAHVPDLYRLQRTQRANTICMARPLGACRRTAGCE